MKPKDIEAKIDRWRALHTEAFKAQEWLRAQSIRDKIIKLWQHWNAAMDQAAEHASLPGLTPAQRKLKKLHGTPEAFEQAIWQACGEISVDEARTAIEKYKREWKIAGTITH